MSKAATKTDAKSSEAKKPDTKKTETKKPAEKKKEAKKVEKVAPAKTAPAAKKEVKKEKKPDKTPVVKKTKETSKSKGVKKDDKNAKGEKKVKDVKLIKKLRKEKKERRLKAKLEKRDKLKKERLAKKSKVVKKDGKKDAKSKDAKSKDAKSKDAKDKDAKSKDAKDKDAKPKDAKDKDAKPKDAKDKDAKPKDAKDKDAKKDKKKKTGKTTADKPKAAAAGKPKDKKIKVKKVHPDENNLIKRPRSFHIGGDVPPKRDLSRYVRWPAYIRLQRQKKIMYERLKIPALINQFTNTLDKHTASELFKLIKKYKPETKRQKKQRHIELAKAKKEKKPIDQSKPFLLKFGVNHIATLVEQKKAKLVIIANNVDPIEQVIWLPTLCRKMGVPYVIVKGKARLGAAVNLKTATSVAFTTVKPEDLGEFEKLVTLAKANYNDKADQIVRAVGGGKLGQRSSYAVKKREDALRKAQLMKVEN